MQNCPLISVIVPIYMIDRYVGMCIESILNQTYSTLEIILVDDGGHDKCAEICDLYASKDTRVKVIHKPNGGLVSARKAGLLASTGEYISYVDGDDWIGPAFIESMFTATVSGADVVCAGYTRDLFEQSACFKNPLPVGIYTGRELEDLWQSMISYSSYYRPGITTYVWNKLFKREILSEMQLVVDNRISIGEDAAVTYPVLMKSTRVAVIDNISYHYRQREDSMLKQRDGFDCESDKLGYLYQYMATWAKTQPAMYCIKEQVIDYLSSVCIVRSGGLSQDKAFSVFGTAYYGKNIVVCSAGTFGQHLVSRIVETKLCTITGWIDDDYWEYRRFCLNVDPFEKLTSLSFDYVLIASVDPVVSTAMKYRILTLGISEAKILTVSVPDNRETVIKSLIGIDVNADRQGASYNA